MQYLPRFCYEEWQFGDEFWTKEEYQTLQRFYCGGLDIPLGPLPGYAGPVQGVEVPPGIPGPVPSGTPPAETPTGSRADVQSVLRIFQEDDGQWAVQVGGAIYGALSHEVAQRIYANELAKAGSLVTAPPPATYVQPVPAVVATEESDVGFILDVVEGIENVGRVVDAIGNILDDGVPVMSQQQLVAAGATVVNGQTMGTPATGVAMKGMYFSPRANCGAGGWIKYRRKRRKLLSESDFNSLLKLQTLKVNANMTIAISKALTR